MREFLAMTIAAYLILSPLLNIKPVSLNFFVLGAGVLISGFILQGSIDLLNWRYGKKATRQIVLKATVIRLVLIGVLFLVVQLPAAPAFAKVEKSWLDIVQRIIQLSVAFELTTFIRNYFVDPFVFDKLRKRGWLASSFGSDLAGEIVSSAGNTFIGYATWGYPLLTIFLTRIAYRMVFSIGKTLILYPVAKHLEKRRLDG